MVKEITKNDFEQIQKELNERKVKTRHELLEEVKRTRAFGDLSENFEYKEAKREKNKNESRIRYLERILKTAKIIKEDTAPDNIIGMFSIVKYQIEGFEDIESIQIVSSMKNDATHNKITRQAPLGKAMWGHKMGDIIEVDAPIGKYNIKILDVKKGREDNLSIRSF